MADLDYFVNKLNCSHGGRYNSDCRIPSSVTFLVAALQDLTVMNYHENQLDHETHEMRNHNLQSIVLVKKNRVYHQTLIQFVVTLFSQIEVQLISFVVKPFNVENMDLDVQVPGL